MTEEQYMQSVSREDYAVPLRKEIEGQFHIADTRSKSFKELYEALLLHITHLVDKDFHQLISLLYRLDISEKRLRRLLAEKPEQDAATIITGLILERLLRKIKTKKEYKTPQPDSSDPEKW